MTLDETRLRRLANRIQRTAETAGVTSVNGDTGDVTLTYTKVGAAPSSEGVTNGNAHDHSGGDGGQISYASLSDTPTIPDQLSDLSDDSTHRLVTDTEKSTWNAKQDALGYTPVPNTRTVNSKQLNADITLITSDISDTANYRYCTDAQITAIGTIANKIDKSTFEAKGDLLVATASATYVRLPVSTDGKILVCDSGETAGIKWTSTIDISTVTLQGAGGKLVVSNNTITVIDGSSHTRVKLGDVDGGFYGLGIYGADGTTALFNETGITGDGIPNGTITYDALNQYLKDNIGFVLGGATIYYQIAEPTGGTYYEGDYWFDIDDDYKAYRYTSGAWVLQSTDQAAYKVGYMIAQFIAVGAVTADKITAGTMLADRISGGTLTVGTAGAARSEMYSSSGSPIHRYYDSGNVLRRSDTPEGIFFYDALGAASTRIATTTADATITVGSGKDYETIQEALDSLPYFINHSITITIYNGTYNEDAHLIGRGGNGSLLIKVNSGDTANVKSLTIRNCSITWWVHDLTLYGYVYGSESGNGTAVWVENCSNFTLVSLNITESNVTHNGIEIWYSKGGASSCTISNRNCAAYLFHSSVSITSAQGSGNSYGYFLYNSVMQYSGNTLTATALYSNTLSLLVPYLGIQTSTDGTFAANSDSLYPTEKTIKTYADTKVAKSLFDAHSILYATTNNTPAALAVTEQTVIGRLTGGNIAALALSGADATVISGTEGTDGNIVQWNADGDAVDSGVAVTEIAAKLTQAGTVPANIADNAAISFTPKNAIGIIDIFGRASTYGATVWGRWTYRTSATVFVQQHYGGSVMATATGALTGTTGTDGKVTVSAHTDGKIYIENRYGSTINICYLLMGS